MEQQPPSVPDIILPAGWNDPGHREPVCQVCEWNGDLDELYDIYYIKKWKDFVSTFGKLSCLESSDAHGCIRCRILAQAAIQAVSYLSEGISTGRYDIIYIAKEWGMLSISLLGIDLKWAILVVLTSHQSREVGAPSGIFHMPHVNINVLSATSSDDSFLWAKDQIESHQDCCQPKNAVGSFAPTRLINVTLTGPGGDVALEENIPKASRYIALSYCWGSNAASDKIDKTTKATFSDYKRRIPWDSIPQTIQDAVIFTRRLGIKYIWVDRFCIIQDWNEDWETESKQMFNIYRHSALTLAAVWGEDSNSGLFSTAKNLKAVLLANLYLNGQCWPLYMQQSHEPHFTWRSGEHEALFTRAWAYQERLIAPRVLYFRKGELSFECFCHTACECGLTHYHLSKSRVRFIKQQFYDEVIEPKENPIAQDQPVDFDIGKFPDENWRSVVVQYTCLNLTKPKDRLVAIQAVADQFQALGPKQEYLWGLWSGSLYHDLLWNLDYRQHAPVENKDAPTWSWASIPDGGVHYVTLMSGDLTPTVKVIEPFIGSVLRLRGRLLPCWLAQKANKKPDLLEKYLLLNRCLGFGVPLCGIHRNDIDDMTGLLAGKPRQKVYLFEVARENMVRNIYIYFLVLRRKDDLADLNRFVRVGCVKKPLMTTSTTYSSWNRHYPVGYFLRGVWHRIKHAYFKTVLQILGRIEEIYLH
ncbi:heterokaryon incompatibility protein-domain-containing protein [Rostrohypoxylon terebratum]|nr:heterokaryon incompatibility protein-domain-containing protein [Rostrohypoxylon terebratum]